MEQDLLPSRDGECVAQLEERRDGLLVAWSSRVLTPPLWLHALNKVEHKLMYNQKVQNIPFLKRITVA